MTEKTEGVTHADIDELAGWITLRRSLTAEISDLEEKRDAVDERIKAALGDAEEGRVGGIPVVRWTRTVSRRLDHALLKSRVAADLLASCYTEQPGRRFIIVAPKEEK